MPRPLALSDEQMSAVLRAAEPLHVVDRDAFLKAVAAALDGRELGDGTVARVAAEVQRRYFRPPQHGEGGRGQGKYR